MKNIAKALAIFHKEMKPVEKDAPNPFFKSTYATLGNILNQIEEPLAKAGLTFVQIPMGEDELKTILIETESGESIEGTMKLMPVKRDPQAQGSAITYGRRYALSAILGISTEEDDDGNAASHPKEAPKSLKKCNVCNKEHNGPYATCIECYKAKKPHTDGSSLNATATK